MGNAGCGCGIIAVIFAIVGFLPLLGWLNWVTTLPAAILAILFSLVGLWSGEQKGTAALGLAVGVVVLFWALFRLSIGGGII